MRKISWMALAVSGLALGACNQETSAGASDAAMQTLQDRIAIEDLITRYYSHLGSGDADGIPEFFTPDAVLDVNGIVKTGHEEIRSLYGDNDSESPAEEGTFHMLLSNPIIEVTGQTAKASFIWTGVLNTDIKAKPELAEQGREYDLLVKQDGKWLITKRVIIADSALPAMYDANFTPRPNYDITAD